MNPSWKEYLLRLGGLESMCKENMDALRSCETKAEAVSLYKKTIDWALEKNYPSVNFIRNEFNDCEDQGIFIDRVFNGELLNEQQCYVFHNCRGEITVDINLSLKIIPMLYFANNCSMRIKRADCLHAASISVPLYIFGSNVIDAESNDCVTFKRHYRDGVV